MRRAFIIALCIIAMCSAIAVVPLLLQSGTPLDVPQHTIEQAISFFKDSHEPYALLWLDVMYRRFEISEFADALQRYDQKLTEHPTDEPLLRVFRRIADHNNVLEYGDLGAVDYDVDRITVPALYCDREALSFNYPTMLYSARNDGEYMLTHVLLALVWIQENGCAMPVPASFINGVYSATAALVNTDSVVTDLELEAAAFLYLAGQDALVDSVFVERVIATQKSDGGWLLASDLQGESVWHSTILALFILLHEKYPAESYPQMLAPAS
jgi:hypothetical protein